MGFNIEGFYVDDAEVTLNVCLGQEFSGGELFFRGVRCEKHVNTETQAEDGRMTIGDQIYAVLLPIIIFNIRYFRRRDVHDLHHAVLGVLYSVLITGVITDAIKDGVGRPRPDLFWRCFPDGLDFYDLFGDLICNGDPAVIKEGHKSFPSGHTSWSFAGLGFLSFYLSGKIQLFDRKGHAGKLCVVFLPLLMAALVGVSRVDDYWHHWHDVFAGGLLGSSERAGNRTAATEPAADRAANRADNKATAAKFITTASRSRTAIAVAVQKQDNSSSADRRHTTARTPCNTLHATEQAGRSRDKLAACSTETSSLNQLTLARAKAARNSLF